MISSNRTALPLSKVFIVRSTGLVLMNADSAVCGGLSIKWVMGGNRLLDADAHNGVNGTRQQLHQWRIETVQCLIAAHGPRVEQHIVDAASGLLLVFREEHSQQIVQTTRTDSRAMLERD